MRMGGRGALLFRITQHVFDEGAKSSFNLLEKRSVMRNRAVTLPAGGGGGGGGGGCVTR